MDEVIEKIAGYAVEKKIESKEAIDTARLCLLDSLGCAILALKFPECTKLLGPVVPGTIVPIGSRVPGTDYLLDPIRGAFNIGIMVRWLDFNDTFLAKEWGHPSDNIGALLALGDYLSQRALKDNRTSLCIGDLLRAIVKAYEIQGVLSLSNSFNKKGFDHVILVKVAATALSAALLGERVDQAANAVSQAWIDVGSLRTYRHAPCAGSRKSWAAGDAASRGVQLALMTLRGEMGYPQAMSAKTWGFNDAILPVTIDQELGSYVIENILFKASFPAEFHAQTAVECALKLHDEAKDRLEDIEKITIETQESAMRIINKTGPLYNPADRDHCLQYMAAVGLIFGKLTANDYEDKAAENPLIDKIRSKMTLTENKQYSKDYLDPDKRSIANAMQIHFKDGTSTEKVVVEYPLGHKKRRKEALPYIFEKAKANFETKFPKEYVEKLLELFKNPNALDKLPIKEFVDLFVDLES